MTGTERVPVAWAVRAPDGDVYVPTAAGRPAGTLARAEQVVEWNQGRGAGVWAVVPLYADATEPPAELERASDAPTSLGAAAAAAHRREHQAYGTWPCAFHDDPAVCPILRDPASTGRMP